MRSMEIKQAVEVLNQALELANQKGAFTLKDASTVNVALAVLNGFFETKAEPAKQDKPEAKVAKVK